MIAQNNQSIVFQAALLTNKHIKETTFKCYQLYGDTHCEFNNIYFDGQNFFANTERYKDITPIMINPLNFSKYWKPRLLNESYMSKVGTDVRERLSMIVEVPFGNNPGHNLLDNLHPMFLKLLILNISPKTPFDVYVNEKKYPRLGMTQKFQPRMKEIYRKFSMGDLYVLQPPPERLEKLVVVKHLYAGIGRHGQKYLNRNYTIVGSREYNSLKLFKDRFHEIYNIKTRHPRNKILIINNKRFVGIIDNLPQLMTKLGKIYNQYSFQFADLAAIKFKKQLQMFEQTILYVSGPGTGLTSHIFLPHHSYVYNLGDFTKERELYYMEEYISESMPYIQTFYYSDNKPSKIYNMTLIEEELVNIIENYVKPHKFTRDPSIHGSGLSYVGKKLIYYCGMFPDYCDFAIRESYRYDVHSIKCGDCAWAEKLLWNRCGSTNTQGCTFMSDPPFICDENFSCKIKK